MDSIQLADCLKKSIESGVEILKTCQIDDRQSKNKLMKIMLHKHLLTAKSIYILLPTNQNNFFDLNSVANLTRNVIHHFKGFYYLTIDKISDEEYELRYLIYQAYDFIERINMVNLLKCDTNAMENELGKLKLKIEKNTFFNSLITNTNTVYSSLYHKITANKNFSKTFRDELIQKEGCYLTDFHIFTKIFMELNLVKSSGVSRKDIENSFKYFYKYLSNYVHSSAFSLSQLFDSGFSNNDIGVDDFLKLIISCNIFYLNLAFDSMLEEINCNELTENQINNFKKNFSGIKPYVNFLLNLTNLRVD